MRFWQKTLLAVLVLFIIALDVSVIIMMNKSWQLNMDREVQRAQSEQELIANNVYENLKSIQSRGMVINDTVLVDIARSYSDYYQKQNIAIQLWNKDQLVYTGSNVARGAGTSNQPTTDSQEVREVVAASELPAPFEHLRLEYRRNIDEIYTSQEELNRYFVYINFITGPMLAIVLYVLIRQLTKPLRLLTATTQTIAAGNYDQQVTLKNKDEFGELAQSFNQMTIAINSHVSELSAMAEDKQRIVDNLAHELRTPLTSMQGFAQYLNAAHISEEERITASGYIWSETLRLKNLVFKLLDLSILRHQAVERTLIDVDELFESVRQLEQKQIDQAGLTLVANASMTSVWGDSDLLASFLVNGIENAIRASSAGSEIHLLAYEEDSAAVLEVRDFGKGMSANQVAQAFEPFYRADHARSRAHGGAGLGLSICQQIAEAHQAEISLVSQEQSGTSLRIFLQLHNN